MPILIVDDTPAMATLVSSLLVAAGFDEPTIAGDGVQALRLLGVEPRGEPEVAADLVLMDILMPEIDGIETCRRLKADARFAAVPVLMVSTLNSPEYLQQAFAAGAVDFVRKPVQLDELAARVQAALDARTDPEQRLADGIDSLTGLPTRPALEAALAGNGGTGGGTALVVLGLDGWAGFVAQNGPAAGDRAIRTIADRLAALFGSLGDLLVRLDAGRFALLCRTGDAARETAAELVRHVSDLAIRGADGATLSARAVVQPLDARTGAGAIDLAVENLGALQQPAG